VIEKSLIKAYRKSNQELENAKEILGKACNSIISSQLPLAQALLEEYYPDKHLEIVDVSLVDVSNGEFSTSFQICVPFDLSLEERAALHNEAVEKVRQALIYIEKMEENEL